MPGAAVRPDRKRFDSMASNGSGTASAWGARPPSPSYSQTTTGSRVNLPAAHALISRKDLRQSIACFEELMAAAKAYRNALLAISSATAAFASALEACSRVKGCRGANSSLAASSGLQYLVSNHEQLLADTVYRQFEIPLLEALDEYKLITQDRLMSYEKTLHEQSQKIRKTEAANLKVGRRKKRDLQQFREALAELQKQVDELDGLKADYHEEVLHGEEELWDNVLNKVSFVVRSQLDFYEKLAGKVSDPILEPMVMSIPDPFDSYGPPKEEGQIISTLAPLGLLDSSTPQSPNPNLTRSPSLHGSPAASPPKKGIPFPTSPPSKSAAEPSIIAAIGENAWLEDEHDRKDRARRELSVIEEREANLSMSSTKGGEESEDQAEASGPATPGRSGAEDEEPTVNEQSEEELDAPRSRVRVGSGKDTEDQRSSRTSVTA